MAVSWVRFINTPFGDNHFGRVGGRYALHVRNLFEDGLIGSSWSANWKPYSVAPYAHHPPLLNILDAGVSLLPGDDPYQVMVAPHLLALLAIPAGAALLRALGIGWVPTLLSIGAMTATGYYWVHSPIMFDVGPILLLAAAVVRLCDEPHPSRPLVVLGSGAAVLATLASWPGIAFAVVLIGWLLAARRGDRTAVAAAIATVAGMAVSLLFMFGVHGWSALADQAEVRAGDADFGFGDFVSRQWQYVDDLLPVWYVVLYPVALVAGVLNRRTRVFTMMSAVMAAAWVLMLRNGAFVHDYWAYLLLIPGLVGMGVVGDWIAGSLRWRHDTAGPAVAALASVAIVASFGTKAFGSYARDYRDRPADAGRLASGHHPAAGQRFAWQLGADGARWLAYYWERPIVRLEGDALTSGAAPSALVFVDLDTRPDWLPNEAIDQAIASRGVYAVFDVATLRELHAAHASGSLASATDAST